MEQMQLKELMDDVDNNDVASIKQKVSDEMKRQVLTAINTKRKELDNQTEE